MLLADSAGLGIFTVCGARVAMEAGDGANRFLVIFVAALTGVGGGRPGAICSRATGPIFLLSTSTPAPQLLGALVCVYLWPLVGRDIAMLVGFVLVFAMRLCSAHFRWSLPHAQRLAEEGGDNLLTRGASRSILKEKQKEETAMKLGVETIWQDRKRVLGMPLTFTKYFLSEDRLFLQTGC